MADPLSIAAGAAGLLSLGIQVTQSLVNFYSAYRDRDKDVDKTFQRLESLLSSLNSLKAALSFPQAKLDNNVCKNIESSINKCEDIIDELNEECKKLCKTSSGGILECTKQVGRRAAYPFRKGTLAKLEEDVQAVQENIGTALCVLNLQAQNRVNTELEYQKKLLAAVRADQLSSELRDWLNAPDASVNYNAALLKRYPDTGLWLTDGAHFRDWLDRDRSFLWLNGFAGCGKSVLCATAIEATFKHIASRPRVGICFFYFSFDDTSKQDEAAMLKTMLLQLSGQLKDKPKDLIELWNRYKTASPPVPELQECLIKILGEFNEAYILVDALDESPRGRTRDSSLDVVNALRARCPSKSHVLVTSRDENDIRFNLNPPSEQDIVMENGGIDNDIKRFIDGHLQSDTYLRKKWAAYNDEIKESLVNRAKGVFRWVECQFVALKRCHQSVRGLRQCLSSLPDTLDETYERMLKAIDSGNVSAAKRLLALLCHTPKPLLVNEVIDALAVDISEPAHFDIEARLLDADGLKEICPGLISIIPTKNKVPDSLQGKADERALYISHHSVVRLAHFSVKEYLESDRISKSQAREYSMDFRKDSKDLLDVCLTYLLNRDLLMEIEVVVTADTFHNKYPEPQAYPFAMFAAQNWHVFLACPTDIPFNYLDSIMRIFNNRDGGAFYGWRKLIDFYISFEFNCFSRYQINEIPVPPIWYAAYLGLSQVAARLVSEPATNMLYQSMCGCHETWLGVSLRAAAFRGHLNTVRTLLDKGADINTRCVEYGTPIMAASYGRHRDVVDFLEMQGQDVNLGGTEYNGSLEAASSSGELQIVELLLNRGADTNAPGALHMAAENGHARVVTMLLDRGVDVHASCQRGRTPLQAASNNGRCEIIELLLRRGADVNAKGANRGDALQAASSGCHIDAVQLLLGKGANVNSQGGDYHTALQAASYGGNIRVVKLLLDKGAYVNSQGGHFHTALQAASCGGYVEVVQLLLDKGAHVNSQGGDYHTALQAASSSSGNVQTMKLLLQKGADINALGGRHGSSLRAAAYSHPLKSEPKVRLLLENGADINAQSGEMGTALQSAALHVRPISQGENLSTVKVLLEKGADVNVQCRRFGSALIEAAIKGALQTVELLLEKGANVNAQHELLGHVLHGAACAGSEKMVSLLIKKGANVRAQGGYFGNVLSAAAWGGSGKLVDFFIEKGLDINARGGLYGNALQAATTIVKDFFVPYGHEPHLRLYMVNFLLVRGADAKLQGGKLHTALQSACSEGELDVVDALLENGADVNPEGGRWGSAFRAAQYYRNGGDRAVRMARRLLEKGDWKPLRLCKDLRSALESSNPAFSEMLVKAGADAVEKDECGRTPVHSAFHHKNIRLIKSQESWTKAITSMLADTAGLTVLHHVARSSEPEACAWVISLCGSVDPADNQLWTPLHWAAYFGRDGNVKVLLDAGADSNRKTNCELLPLDLAIRYGNWETAAHLSLTGKKDWETHHHTSTGKVRTTNENEFSFHISSPNELSSLRFTYIPDPCKCGYCMHTIEKGIEDNRCEDCQTFQGFHLCFRCFKDASTIDPGHKYVKQLRPQHDVLPF